MSLDPRHPAALAYVAAQRAAGGPGVRYLAAKAELEAFEASSRTAYLAPGWRPLYDMKIAHQLEAGRAVEKMRDAAVELADLFTADLRSKG